MNREVILTGIRSNDEPTLGNYIGALLPMAELQRRHSNSYQINMFVPDLHSFTTPVDHAQLYQNTARNIKYFVAAGLDIFNPNTYIYRQSYVPAHSELTWILSCFTYFGELRRMTQFKDKALQHTAEEGITGDSESDESLDTASQHVSAGLFNYPVLMAADILLYNARWVPVGEDQRQHLELTRDLAIRCNNKFGDIFTVPEAWNDQLAFAGRDQGVRIRSLRNPEKKMSKSIADPAGTILLSDPPVIAAKKIMAATTDSLGSIRYDFAAQPGVSNLLLLIASLSARPLDSVREQWEGKPHYGELKKTAADLVSEFLSRFQAAYAAVDEQALIQQILAGEKAMNEVANATLRRVQEAVGLRPKAT